MPCYNERASLRETVTSLHDCLSRNDVNVHFVLVDNGSSDDTGKLIDDLIEEGLPADKVIVNINQGYGHGVLQGMANSRGQVVGVVHADGQIRPLDVLRVYRHMSGNGDRVLAKARRLDRHDGRKRRAISSIYNALVLVAYGWLGTPDINASPKFLRKDVLDRMQLSSRDWLIDLEIMVKAKYLGLIVIDVPVSSHVRRGGASHVGVSTCLEFLKNILMHRMRGTFEKWHRTNGPSEPVNGRTVSGTDSQGTAFQGVVMVPNRRHEDSRGHLQKIWSFSQHRNPARIAEIYVSAANKGESKGNHFHKRMGEWFSIIQGEGKIEICEPASGLRKSVPVRACAPCSVYVPPGLAHAIVNTGNEALVCLALAEAEHDPQDVFPYQVWPILSKSSDICDQK